jgi:hypothetical protein
MARASTNEKMPPSTFYFTAFKINGEKGEDLGI